MRVEIDQHALQAELRGFVNRGGATFMRPVADAVTVEATRIASRNFRHVGAGVASIHNEYVRRGTTGEYRISYDGEKHSYMGLWEIGTREFPPRPYLRPAVDAVKRRL